MSKKVNPYPLFVFIFCIGLLCLYRSLLKPSQMTVVTGRVINKGISSRRQKGGHIYCLSLKLAGRQDKIAVKMDESRYIEAEQDSINNLIDTGKTYTFYLDPSVPTSNGENWGIDKIDYNGSQIFMASNTFNLYLGIFLCLMSATAFVIVLKTKKKSVA